MLFSSEQISRGRKIVNTGIIILIFLLLADIALSLVSNGIKGLTRKTFISGIILFNIFLYCKGNRIAFIITMFLLSGVYIFIFGLLPAYLVLGLLRVLNVLDSFGGALYLVVPAIIITAVSILVFKTEFNNSVLAFKTYWLEKIKN